VSARIAIRVRVDAEKLAHPHPEPRFLESLARAALLRALSPLEKTAREPPFPLEGRAAPADQKKAAGGVADPGVHGDARDLFLTVELPHARHHSSGEP
jgi:hypothetical protein